MATRKQAPKAAKPDFAEALAQAEANQRVERRQVAVLRAALEREEIVSAGLRQRLDLIETVQATPLVVPEWIVRPKSGDKHVGVPSLLLTDVHYDEVVSLAETGGINKYDRAIANQRIARAFERSIRLGRDYLSGVQYPGCTLMLGGDIVSGVIHEELSETNQHQIMDTVVSVSEQLCAGIRLLREAYGRVHVVGVVGNHGRRTKKPRHKGRVQDNFDWLVYKLVERELADASGVSFNFPVTADARVTMYDTDYVLTHGDQFRGGSGISGIFTPLRLGEARKQQVYNYMGQPFDVMVFGHFHQALPIPSSGLIGGGSLIGYSEYSIINNFKPEPPRCEWWVTTPEHGPTFHAPVFVQNKEKEGWA